MEIMKKFLIICAVLFTGLSLYAQSADVVTDILSSDEVTFGQAAYISASSQGLIKDEASMEDALSILIEKEQIAEDTESSDVLTIQDLAGIYAKAFDVKGGLFYKLTKGSPRYAFKYFKTEGLIPTNTDPSKYPTGTEALSLFTKCNLRYGEAQFTDEL